MNVEENSYEEYKRNLSATRKKQSDRHAIKVCLIVGTALLLYALATIPFHASPIRSVGGEELKVGQTYLVNKLYILDVKVDQNNDDNMYCVARFYDKNSKPWILSFTPGTNASIRQQIERDMQFGLDRDWTVMGYVILDSIPNKARSYYSSRSKAYASSPDAEEVLQLNADYLCEAEGNYTIRAILRPGYTKASFFVGIIGIAFGLVKLFKSRNK